MRSPYMFCLLSGGLALWLSGADPTPGTPPLRTLQKQLQSSAGAEKLYHTSLSVPVRRRAFQALLEQSEDFNKTALRGMKDPDPMIRRFALRAYLEKNGKKGEGVLKTMVREKDPVAAEYVLWCSQRISSKEMKMAIWKELSVKSPLPEIRKKAKRFASFDFFRKNVRLQDDPTWDHEVILVKAIPLPSNAWRFRLDPWEDGHKRGYFKPEFNDSYWKTIAIGQSWEKQGYAGYDGIAWYRIRFKAPVKGDANAAELFFKGVDEGAWVWLNGKYVGQQDMGPSGWNKPFYLDITKEIQWGSENVLTVRVEDSMASGGIWKEVLLHILK